MAKKFEVKAPRPSPHIYLSDCHRPYTCIGQLRSSKILPLLPSDPNLPTVDGIGR